MYRREDRHHITQVLAQQPGRSQPAAEQRHEIQEGRAGKWRRLCHQDGPAVLKQSMAACESSIKSSERFNDETDLTRAEADFNNSAALKRKITANSKLIASEI